MKIEKWQKGFQIWKIADIKFPGATLSPLTWQQQFATLNFKLVESMLLEISNHKHKR